MIRGPVLVVDDYGTMRRILRNLLEQIGFPDSDEAPDGNAAWEKLQVTPFGLVIADLHMEPMSGIDLLRKVRADLRTQDVPFIMVTAERNIDNVVAAKEAGVDNYIIKPFNGEALRRKIDAALGVAKERQAARATATATPNDTPAAAAE